MKNQACGLVLLFLCACSTKLLAQTSWKGTTSTNWSIASNWTAGVPTATVSAIIGDASFTGANQPVISSSAFCSSLTIGGTVASTLTISKTLSVSGSLTIQSNGTIIHNKTTVSLKGNWTNNGTYTGNFAQTNVNFIGSAQSINGTSVTSFRKATINSSSAVTLGQNIAVANTLTVNGTLNPNESPTYQVTGGVSLSSTGTLLVKAATFAGNYTGSVTASAGSIVDYSATTVAQIVSNTITYSTLRISGSGTKTLAGNLPALNATTAATGNIYITAGTLDASSFTADRGTAVAGGTLSISNGAFLKLGGTTTFPSNFATTALSLTSTVEYNGTAQTIAAQTYGNLILSGSGGVAVKTLPATDFTIAGNFTMAAGNGTSVSATAASNITISGDVNLGVSTTFNGGSFVHQVTGNWVNNGTLTGSTSTIILNGSGISLSGTGLYVFNNVSIIASNNLASTDITVAGNLSTTGSGSFSMASGKTLTLSGTSKTIIGTGFTFDNLLLSGSITSATSFMVNGNITVTGSLAASDGTITMSGTGKIISGSGAIGLYGLRVSGAVTTTASLSVNAAMDVSGSFNATSPSTVTFTGASTLNGTANLYNVTLNGTSLQLSTDAVLGIANTYTITAGTLNVSASTPNTVNFNGTTAQSIPGSTYHNLVFSNGNTKTAAGAITINGNVQIASGTTFNAGTFSHAVQGNWVNAGTFTAGTSTINFTGIADATITGATTFSTLTVSKAAAGNKLTLLNNITVATLNMTSHANGFMQTGSNKVTITNTRTGTGIIIGTIQRTHAFTTGTSYAFEGPDNSINFSAVSGVSSVTVNVTLGSIGDFPFGSSVNRTYDITIPSGTYTATLRLHYEDNELNGNNEALSQLWKYNISAWAASGKTVNDVTNNYVEKSGLTAIATRWTISDDANVLSWNGSVSTDWFTAGNWTAMQGSPSPIPSETDIVEIGDVVFNHQPSVNNEAHAKGLVFGSAKAATLTLAGGGSLTIEGNISGAWSTSAAHSIVTGNGTLTVNGDLVLSDGITGHIIDINSNAGSVAVSGSLTQSGGAAINFTGNTMLAIGKDYNYSSGTFGSGTGTVVYNGTGSQQIASITYNNLTINKTSGIAKLSGTSIINNALIVNNGTLDISAPATIAGNVTIAATGILDASTTTLMVGGNWAKAGAFLSGNGTVTFNGSASQNISSSTFNNIIINSAGTVTLSGNAALTGNMTVTSGSFDLATYTANRTTWGGVLTLAANTTMLVGAATNFPVNFASTSLNSTSTVHYNGTTAQTIAGATYGNLVLSNGSTNAKSLAASTVTNGSLTINSGAAFHANAYTVELYGNWTNNGTFDGGTGTTILYGANKIISGNTSFYRVTIYGSYTVDGSNINFNNNFRILSGASYNAGSGFATISGDFTNSGILYSSGTTTFTGAVVQTIRLLNAIQSTSTGVINFNGSVSPVLNSTSSPNFATININNTAGLNPSVNWTTFVAFNVSSGASFNGGVSTHNFYGSFTNNGTVTSSGTLNISPAATQTIKLAGTGFTSTGTVIFGGTGAMTVTGTPTLKDVTITNTAGVTPSTGWNISNNFTVGSTGIFNAGSNSYTVGGDIESNGTLNGGSSTFTMTAAAGQISGSPATTFNNFTVAGASITANSDFNIAGNLVTNGNLDASLGSVHFTGAGSSTISGSNTNLVQFGIEKATGSAVTLARNVTLASLVDVTSGTLDAGSFTIAQDPSDPGTLLVHDNATLKVGGTNTLPAFTTYDLDSLSTVEYNGGVQAIAAATPYGNLTLSATGSKTPNSALTIKNNFTLSNGTFAAGNHTHAVGGNWTMTGGTYTNTGSTIQFNGTADQSISSTGAFNNLTVNKTAGNVNLSAAATVNGTLGFISGKVSLGANNLTLGTAGTITGATTSNYIIANNAGSLVQPVTNGGSKAFPIGTASHHIPVTIALTAGSASDNFSARVLGAAYSNGTTGTAVTNSAVNASWVLGEAVAGGTNATITLQWPLALELSGFSRSASRLAQYLSNTWNYGSSATAASGTNPYSISRAAITSLSTFAVSNFEVLPVTWLSVDGQHKDGKNIITWSTAAEWDNLYFAVEAAGDGMNFTEVGQVKGGGTNLLSQHYQFEHKKILTPVTYYRVKQVDNNGQFTYSPVILIKAPVVTGVKLLSGNNVTVAVSLSITMKKSGKITALIHDAGGKMLQQHVAWLAVGANNVNLNVQALATGVYFLNITGEDGSKTTLRIVKKV